MIFTFGYGHSINGIPLKKAFYRIPLPSAEARERMFAMFGTAWGFEYETEEEAGVDTYELTELTFDHPTYGFIGALKDVDPFDICLCGGVRKDHESDTGRKGKANPERVLKDRELTQCLHCPCPEFVEVQTH